MSNNQQQREQFGKRALEAILNDIRYPEEGARFRAVCDGSVNMGYFCHDWGIAEEDALGSLFGAIDASTSESDHRTLRDVAETCFIHGLENPKTWSFDS